MGLDVWFEDEDGYPIFNRSITHNLNKMAAAAGLYSVLWRPEEINATQAKHITKALAVGLVELVSYPDKYKEYNPENGWGTYEGLVNFVMEYLRACTANPEAEIHVSR